MRTNATFIAIATILAAASTGIWFLICEKQDAQERGATFFGSSRRHLTSGGEKMKVEW